MSRVAALTMATAMLTFCLPRVSYAHPTATGTELVAKAERVLADDPREAARIVFAHFPQARTAMPGRDAIKTRALRVLALAIVRSDGVAAEPEVRRLPNIEWAVQVLHEIEQVRVNDPSVQADLGEALSKLPHPHARAKAREILERLAKKGLLESPHASAALATLRRSEGPTDGRPKVRRIERWE